MKFNIGYFFKTCSLVIFILLMFFSGKSYASTNDCIDKINKDRAKIAEDLDERGNSFYWACGDKYPYLFITLTDLDDSENKISITHSPKKNNKYLLKTITDHVNDDNVVIAINGFTWVGEIGCSDADLLLYRTHVRETQCIYDKGYAFSDGYASHPSGTVYVDGEELYTRTDGNEASIGFSPRSVNGTESKLTVGTNGNQIEEGFNYIVDSSTDSIIKNYMQSHPNDPYNDRVSAMGIGKFGDKQVLILISSSNDERSKANDHYKIFKELGATDAIRLDGSTAASLYFQGSAKGHVNPLEDQPIVKSDARKIMYALTISRVAPIVPESKIEFENIKIRDWVKYGKRTYFSGKVTSKKSIAKITLKVTKPGGTEIIDGEYAQPNNILEKDLSVFSFGSEDYVDMLGRYTITFIVEDTSGYKAQKKLVVEVIPNVTQVSLSPLPPLRGSPFYVNVVGEKLNTDIRATIGTDDTECELSDKSDNMANFSCHAYNAGRFRLRIYYDGREHVLYEKLYDFNECIPNSTETKVCSITNGSGVNTRICASDGMSWGTYEGCKVSSCDAGYVISGNSCVEQDNDKKYDFYLSDAKLNKASVKAGAIVTASVTSNYSGNVLNSDMDSVNIGYYLSSNTSFGASDVLLDDDSSSLGTDDTFDPESAELTISSSTVAGDYYILFITDHDEIFLETNESNNLKYVKIKVTSETANEYDFYIENAKLSKTSAYPGDEITASMDVYYSGNVLDKDMGGVKTVYYLVAADGTQEYLGSDTSHLGSDDTSDRESLSFTLPSTLKAGTYYVAFLTDYDKQYAETNEGNNSELVKIEVKQESTIPSITELDPASPRVYQQGAFTRRTAYVYGANFKTSASVKLCWSTDCHTLITGNTSGQSYSEVLSSNIVKIHFSPGDTPDNWNVTVTNPDGQESNTFNFSTSY